MAEAARRAGVHLVLGGMPELPAGDQGGAQAAAQAGAQPGHGSGDRVHNSCVLLGPDGALHAVYRKIHLFDVQIPDGVTYQESKLVAPGDEPVVAETPWGGLGLSVCYDLRFPELYRALAANHARMIVVPAAFTLHTGRDHWHVLLRARAIENQAFVIAAAQWGTHEGKRQTYGHSLIVDPWGCVLADAGDGEGMALAELDMARLERVRRELPALGHRRL
jgi:predicted amidohydrolase